MIVRAAKGAGVGGNVSDRWRVTLDRAWRSAELRRQFEEETGKSDRDEPDTAAAHYDSQFALWAMKHFGLQKTVPAAIQRKWKLQGH